MEDEFKRTTNSFFNNFQQQANALQFDRSRSQFAFQQQSQGVVPQGYYPANQNSRPAVTSPPLNASSLGFYGTHGGNYGQYQSNLSGSGQWRSQVADANSGLSSLAFASVLADGRSQPSPQLSHASTQGSSQSQQQRSNTFNAQRSSATPSYSANTSQTRMPQPQPSTANNWTRPQSRGQQPSSNQGAWQNRQWRQGESASPVNQPEQPSNTSGYNATTASQSMFVNPSQVYNAPVSHAPKSPRTAQQAQQDQKGQQDSDDGSQSSVQITNEAPSKEPPQKKVKASSAKQNQKRSADTSEAKTPKKRARKTGSTTAPSSKQQENDANGSKNDTPAAYAGSSDSASLEAQMREMFMKMREFNSANPELLARLWQEEREGHVARTTAGSTQPANEASPAVASTESTGASAPKKKNPKAKGKSGVPANESPAAKATPVPAVPAGAKTTTPTKPTQPASNRTIPSAGSSAPTAGSATQGAQEPQAAKERSTPKSSATKQDKSPANRSEKRATVVEAPVEPATKEDRAYKKTFADLVDLTMDSSEDESPMFSLQAQHTQNPHSPAQPPSHSSGMHLQSMNDQLRPQLNRTGDIFWIDATARPAEPRIRPRPPINVTLAQPIDKYKAIRRSRYNPKTIARDVLLACGRHPDMRHLNEHLVVLKDTFPSQLDLYSDLSSIRWDLIDPGGPPTGSASIRPAARVEDESSDEFVNEAFAPLPRPKRQASPRPQDLSGRNGQSYATPPSSGLKLIGGRHPDERRVSAAMDSNTRPVSTPRRRGRPPGASSKAGPSRGDSRASTPSGYTALRAAQAERGGGAEQPKKRGRPVGWRKWMMKEGTGYSATNKPPAEQAVPEPFYHIYKCQWSGCTAELHNLDTLRKHLSRVHEPNPASIRCLWSDCGKPQPTSDASSGRVTTTWARLKFDTHDEFKGHLEKAHLSPIAWKFGDGPTAGISDHNASDASEACNSDSHGRSVTPQIKIPNESVRESLYYEKNILSGGRIPKKSPEERARDVLRAVESEKRAIGPGIDRGGARFANEKRRMGFVDDNDSEITIDEDD